MSSHTDPSGSCTVQEDETSSVYWDPEHYDVYDPEELEDEHIFEKPRGKRRWLGKEHHRGKERIYNGMKDSTFIKKTIKEPISKRAIKRIGAATKDQLEFDVFYSLYKKSRWRLADITMLLGNVPENVNAEVVEKNALEHCGFMYPAQSTFAVHSRNLDGQNPPGEFEIRSATSSGKGQHYSNFLPSSRELSKKANAKMMTIRDEMESKTIDNQPPTVSYNIYKSHRSRDVVGRQMFKSKWVGESRCPRVNQKIDLEISDDEEDFDYDEEEDETVNNSVLETKLNLQDFIVDNCENQNQKQNKKHRPRKVTENSYEFIDHEALEPEPGFTNMFNIQEFLRNEGYTFVSADIQFCNQKDNIKNQIKKLVEKDNLEIKELRRHQYLIDVSKWCQLEGGKKDGEVTAIIVITHFYKNTYNVLVNSTIPCHPSKRGSDYLKEKIERTRTMREAIAKITEEMLTHRKIVETMKMAVQYYGRKTLPEMYHDCSEWENQMTSMEWPNEHYHAIWANSEELSTVGNKMEWEVLCAMARKDTQLKECFPSNDKCGTCSPKKRFHELYLVDNDSSIKCNDCLRDEFYRELRAKRIPIDLQMNVEDELEHLPVFVPLTIVNHYIRLVSEKMLKQMDPAGDSEKCNSCKSLVFFSGDSKTEKSKKSQNRTCPCGYSWCRHCDRVPHWPMECGDFAEWDSKWQLRYAVIHAQGSGTENLMEIACSCGKTIYNVLLPVDIIECPTCKINVNMHTNLRVWKHFYYPYYPPLRKMIAQGLFQVGATSNRIPYMPRSKVVIEIVKIPEIRASVIEICKAARDARYDVHFRNRAIYREHVLIRKKILKEKIVENIFGTVSYLVETVTTWMYSTNQYDRHVKHSLGNMLENRKELTKFLGEEDGEAIMECVRKIRREIEKVIAEVEKKMEAPQHPD